MLHATGICIFCFLWILDRAIQKEDAVLGTSTLNRQIEKWLVGNRASLDNEL